MNRFRVLSSTAVIALGFGGAYSTYASAESSKKLPKLTYFDIPGRAFAIRAALRHAHVPFEDNRISYPELVEGRGPSGKNAKYPLGQVPTLELPSGHVYCQSASILRWAARQSDLYPRDPEHALLCDEVMESLGELRMKLPEAKDADERKKLREAYIQGEFAKYMEYISSRLEQSGGPYLLGKHLTMPDLILSRFIAGVADKKFDFVSLDVFNKYPLVLKLYETTKSSSVYKNEIQAEEALQLKKKSSH